MSCATEGSWLSRRSACDFEIFQHFKIHVGVRMKLMPWGVVLAGISLVSCQTPRQALPPDAAKQVDNVFEKWDRPASPGCALGIYKDGQIVYKRGYGMANLNDDVPITPATVFHVASMSKQFTAASILLLAQQGKLSLDDDIHKNVSD